MMMAPWEAGMFFIAIDEKTGKPTTTPSEVSSSSRHCRGVGHAGRRRARSNAAAIPARAARPMPMKTGCRSTTARRVIGRVAEKISTPMRPNSMPAEGAGMVVA